MHFYSIVRRNLCLAVMLSVVTVVSYAQPQLSFKVYPIPSGGDVYAITSGPDGALWMTALASIWRSTTSGQMTEFILPDDGQFYSGGRGLWDITVGPDQALWFVESSANKIGRITTDGVIREFWLAGALPSPQCITAGSDGALWFTEWIDRIGRLTTSGDLSTYKLTPCQGTCGRYPHGITTGPDGALWFTDLGDDRIHRITTSGVVTDYAQLGYAPGDITTGPDGALWFTGGGGHDVLGRIDTAGVMTLFPLPIYQRPTYNGYNNLEPSSITTGPDQALWFTSSRVNVIGRMTTQGNVTLYDLPNLGLSNENYRPSTITLGSDGALWVAVSRYLVRVSLVRDTTPPNISMRVTPIYISQANGPVGLVTVSGRITDTGSGVAANSLSYNVVDEYDQYKPSGLFTLDNAGNYMFTVALSTTINTGDSDGMRHYGVVVSAADNAGNRSAQWRFAIVTR